jgi:hypothetical protein
MNCLKWITRAKKPTETKEPTEPTEPTECDSSNKIKIGLISRIMTFHEIKKRISDQENIDIADAIQTNELAELLHKLSADSEFWNVNRNLITIEAINILGIKARQGDSSAQEELKKIVIEERPNSEDEQLGRDMDRDHLIKVKNAIFNIAFLIEPELFDKIVELKNAKLYHDQDRIGEILSEWGAVSQLIELIKKRLGAATHGLGGLEPRGKNANPETLKLLLGALKKEQISLITRQSIYEALGRFPFDEATDTLIESSLGELNTATSGKAIAASLIMHIKRDPSVLPKLIERSIDFTFYHFMGSVEEQAGSLQEELRINGLSSKRGNIRFETCGLLDPGKDENLTSLIDTMMKDKSDNVQQKACRKLGESSGGSRVIAALKYTIINNQDSLGRVAREVYEKLTGDKVTPPMLASWISK